MLEKHHMEKLGVLMNSVVCWKDTQQKVTTFVGISETGDQALWQTLSLYTCHPDLPNLWDWERELEHGRNLRFDQFNSEGWRGTQSLRRKLIEANVTKEEIQRVSASLSSPSLAGNEPKKKLQRRKWWTLFLCDFICKRNFVLKFNFWKES